MTVQETKLTNYLAITLCCSVCLQRLSTVVGNIFFIIAILIFLYLLYSRKKASMRFFSFQIDDSVKGYYKAFGIFFISLLPAALFTGDIGGGLGFILEKWVYRWFPFFAITLFIRDKQILMKMLLAFMVSIGLDCLVAVGQSFILNKYRPWGLGGHPLHLANTLCFLIPILTVFALDKRFSGNTKLIVLFVLGCCLMGGLVGNSRGAWLTLAVTLPIMAWPYIKNNKKNACIAAIICCMIAGVFASSPTYQKRLISITNTTTNRSNADRIVIWRSALDMIEDHPIVGVGPGNFKEVYDKQYVYPEMTQNLTHPHNTYLQFATEYGMIGLGGFLYCIFYMMKRNYIEARAGNVYARMRLGLLLGLLLFGIIETPLKVSAINKVLGFLLAILLMLDFKSEKNNTET